MKHQFAPDQQDSSGGAFNPAWDDPNFQNFLPLVGHEAGIGASATPVVPTPVLSAEAVESEAAQSGPTTAVAETSSGGGITINLEFDAAAMAAPASFRAGIGQAAAILSAAITNKITVNLQIDYSGTGGGAAAGPDSGQYQSYATVRTDLIAHAAPGDTTFNALPTGSTIQGQAQVAVWNAQLKLWGLLPANSTTTDDGSATFATDINPNLLVGVALHELTHALGRVPYGEPDGPQPDIFDLFRFTGVGTRLFTDNLPASASYFSLNGGTTKIGDYGRNSDPSDFLSPPGSNLTPNDAFNEYYNNSTNQTLTTIDKQELDALGFNTNSAPAQRVESAFTGNGVSDIAFASSHDIGYYTTDNNSLQGWQELGLYSPSYSVVGIGNFNGGTTDDILFRDSATGDTGFYNIVNGSNAGWIDLGASSTAYSVAGIGDFTGAGTDDILFHDNANGDTGFYAMKNGVNTGWHDIGASSAAYSIVGVGDFTGGGTDDILFRNNANGDIGFYAMNNGGNTGWHDVGVSSTAYSVVGTGDFTGSGADDILFRNNATGDTGFYQISNGVNTGWHDVGASSTAYNVVGIGDYNGSGTDSILFRNNTTGDTGFYQMVSGSNAGWHDLGASSTTYHVVS